MLVEIAVNVGIAERDGNLGLAILELLEANGIEAEAVGGLTMGADPIVSNVATASAWRAIERPGSPLLHGFLVRKAEKAHGTGRRVEGFCREGARVVIVDDVCTTGGSTIKAIDRIRQAGHIVEHALILVDREEGGREAIEAYGVEVHVLVTRTELLTRMHAAVAHAKAEVAAP